MASLPFINVWRVATSADTCDSSPMGITSFSLPSWSSMRVPSGHCTKLAMWAPPADSTGCCMPGTPVKTSSHS